MSVAAQDRGVIEGLYKAMQAGPAGENEALAFFAADAIFTENFGGAPKTHAGIAAIRTAFQKWNEDPPPDVRLELDRVDLDGGRVRAEWTCYSPAFSVPMRGVDHFTIEHGKIRRLEVVVTQMPPM